MAKIHIGLDGIWKIAFRKFLGPLVLSVKGREGILFTYSQAKFGWSQNFFNTSLGSTITLDKIHGLTGEFTVKLTSEIIMKGGGVSLKFEGSILTAFLQTGTNMLSIGSKTFNLRVSK